MFHRFTSDGERFENEFVADDHVNFEPFAFAVLFEGVFEPDVRHFLHGFHSRRKHSGEDCVVCTRCALKEYD